MLGRLLSACLILLSAACGASSDDQQTVGAEPTQPVAFASPFAWKTLNGRPPAVIAHRGASGYLPEHTLEAYELAIDQGADLIEPDLVITKDGVLVARHDRYLSTTTDVADRPEYSDRRRTNRDEDGEKRDDWWVEDFTLAEIKSLRAVQPRQGRTKEHDGQYQIPTFEEILILATVRAQEDGRPIGVYPETKYPGYFSSIGLDFISPLTEAIETYDAGPVYVQSFEPGILKTLSGKTPAMLVQLLYEQTPGAGPNIQLSEVAMYADGVGPSKSLIVGPDGCETGFVAAAHEKALFVHPWTFRDDVPVATPAISPCAKGDLRIPIEELKHAFETGVDGVFTDFPDTAIAARDTFIQ